MFVLGAAVAGAWTSVAQVQVERVGLSGPPDLGSAQSRHFERGFLDKAPFERRDSLTGLTQNHFVELPSLARPAGINGGTPTSHVCFLRALKSMARWPTVLRVSRLSLWGTYHSTLRDMARSWLSLQGGRFGWLCQRRMSHFGRALAGITRCHGRHRQFGRA